MRPISAVVLCAALLLPGVAKAGWGAIAYNPATGASTEAHGQAHLSTALNAALTLALVLLIVTVQLFPEAEEQPLQLENV